MALRWLGKLFVSMGLLLLSSCVSPVELPTEREVLPPTSNGSIPLVLQEVLEASSVLTYSSGDSLVWQQYAVEVTKATLDTSGGIESLRLSFRIYVVHPPAQSPVWVDRVELLVGGLRRGVRVEDWTVVRSFRLLFWEANQNVQVQRVWEWLPGDPPLTDVRLQFQLVQDASPAARWVLSFGLSFVGPDSPNRPLLLLRCAFRLAPA